MSRSSAVGLWAALAVVLLAMSFRTSMVPLSASSAVKSKLLSSFQGGLRSLRRDAPSAEEVSPFSIPRWWLWVSRETGKRRPWGRDCEFRGRGGSDSIFEKTREKTHPHTQLNFTSHQPLPPPPPPPHTTWGDVAGEYIVRFREYAPSREHERALEASMPGAIERVIRSGRSSSGGGGGGEAGGGRGRRGFLASLLQRGASSSPQPAPAWRWVPRDNPAAAFPTDFGVLRLGGESSGKGASDAAASAASAALSPPPPSSSSSSLFRPSPPSPSTAEVLAALRSLPFVRDVHAQRKLTRALAWVDAANKEEEEERETAPSSSTNTNNNDDKRPAFSALSSLFDAGRGGILKRPGRLTTRPTLGLFSGDDDDDEGAKQPAKTSSSSHRRSLRDAAAASTSPSPPSVAAESGAPALWRLGHLGAGVRVGVFDTSVRADHPDIAHVDERSNWTHEPTLDDGLGHGSFVAGVVAAGGRDVLAKPTTACPGLAPLARIHTFRVFTNDQVSFTSWFLDAFNYAMATKMHIINLSIGGPDWLDAPFVDKVAEVTASGTVMVSAIGNDGPNYGTCNNPADQADVIGVGGIGYDNSVAGFSSRGATTWEAPRGAGRVKPDVVAFGRDVSGARIDGGCRQLSGTSVASPVVAGAAALLASTLPADAPRFHVDGWRAAAAGDGEGLGANRSFSAPFSSGEDFPVAVGGGGGGEKGASSSSSIGILNPASMKQALIEGADRLPDVRAAEQGAGKINLAKSAAVLKAYKPRASAFPAALDLVADCPYLWPHCEQPLFARGSPLMLNVTLLNGMGPTGRVVGEPTFTMLSDSGGGDGGNKKSSPSPPDGLLEVRFEHSHRLYPWSGFLAVYVHVADSPAARAFDGVVRGEIEVTVASPRAMVGDGDRRRKKGSTSSENEDDDEITSTVTIPLVARVVPTPPRSKRLLWDQRHSVRYPPSYLPRDSLSVKHDVLDWHGEKKLRVFNLFFFFFVRAEKKKKKNSTFSLSLSFRNSSKNKFTGDHLHTNYHTLFTFLRSRGYFVDILGSTFDCFSAEDYGMR